MNQEQPIGSDQQGLVSARRRSSARWELKSRVALTIIACISHQYFPFWNFDQKLPEVVFFLLSFLEAVGNFYHFLEFIQNCLELLAVFYFLLCKHITPLGTPPVVPGENPEEWICPINPSLLQAQDSGSHLATETRRQVHPTETMDQMSAYKATNVNVGSDICLKNHKCKCGIKQDHLKRLLPLQT